MTLCVAVCVGECVTGCMSVCQPDRPSVRLSVNSE